MITNYNQRLDKYSRLGCTVYSLFTILEYNYGLVVKNSFILKALALFERLGKRSSTQGAVFNIIYPAFIYQINKRLGLKLKIYKTNVYSVKSTDTKTYGIGVKKYCRPFALAESRGEITKKDVDDMVSYKGKSYMHNLCWDGSNEGYIINTDGSQPFKCTIEVLRYMADKGIIWTPMRTITTYDEYTARILDITLQMKKNEQLGRTYKILKKDYDIKNKILELYNYGK